MVKRFNEPTPEPTPEIPASDPVFARTSAFSPFGDPVEDRKTALGERLFSVNETVEEIPDHEVDTEFAIMEDMFNRAPEVGVKGMMSLVKAYRTGSTPNKNPQDQKRKIVKFYRELQNQIKNNEDLDAVILSMVGNLSYLLAKTGR